MHIKGMSLIRLHPEPKVWSSESSRNVTQQRENMMRHKSGRSFSKKTTSTAKLAKVMSISAARTLMTYVLEHLNCICACYRLTVSSVLSPGLIHWLKHDAFTEQSLAGRTLSLLRENKISQVVSFCFLSLWRSKQYVQLTHDRLDHLSWAFCTARPVWAHFVPAGSNKTLTKWAHFTDK